MQKCKFIFKFDFIFQNDGKLLKYKMELELFSKCEEFNSDLEDSNSEDSFSKYKD